MVDMVRLGYLTAMTSFVCEAGGQPKEEHRRVYRDKCRGVAETA